MSDQGGTNQAGWQPDPHGRHEYRYWDGTAWTDQVSDGGVVASDPPGGPPSLPPNVPAAAPAGGGRSKVSIGLLALIGLVVAALVAGLVIVLGGGDDGGGSGGTGAFSGTISRDEPFVVRSFDLEPGEAFRVLVEPDSDLDPSITLGVEPDLARTQLFGYDPDADDLLEAFDFYYGELLSSSVDGDLSDDLSAALSEDFSTFQDQLSEQVPSLDGAGIPLGTNADQGTGEPEGSLFMAPLGGRYSIIVSGDDSTGDFDARIETTGPDGDFEEQDPDDEIDLTSYYAGIAPLRDFLCDEDFWGGDPADVSEQTGQICDDETFDDLLSSDFSDFTTDVSDFSDFSDLTSDFSDFTDDGSDFSDFTDDVPDGTDTDAGSIEVGDSIDGDLEAGERDLYTLDGTGDTVTFEVVGSNDTGGLDPTVAVEDSTGNQIGFNDDGDPSNIGDSLLEVDLEAGETYTVIVAGFSTSSGDYTISVS